MAEDMHSVFKIVQDLYQLLRNSSQGKLVLDGSAKLTLPVFVLEKLNNIFLQIDNSATNERIPTELLQNVLYLQEFINKTPKLKLTHLKGPLPSEVDITRFVNLRYIELVHVNLQNVKGLQALRPQLELLACTSSTDNFEDILAGDANSLQIWEELRTLDLSYNKIELLGNRTFISTPWVQHLDLSSNKLAGVGTALEFLNNLKYLNLSYNQLDSLPFLSQESYRKLQVLLLCHNFIEDISDVWLFNNLNKLDLSYNLLDDHVNITSLAELKKLQWLNFTGNPLSYHRYHRTYTCVCLSKTIPIQSIILDNQKLNSDEMKVVGTRSGRAVYTSPYHNSGHQKGTSRKYRRTVSSTSSANSFNTVISASIHQPSVGSISEQFIPDNDTNVPSTSGTQRDEKLSVNPSMSRSLSSSGGRKMARKSVAREAVIVDADQVVQPPPPLPQPDGNGEHLEIKKELEVLRERFGEDHWLHSHAGSFVQDLLGLQKTPQTSILSEMSSSRVSFEDENKQKSKPDNSNENEKQSKISSPVQKSSNVEVTGISNDGVPDKNRSKTDSSSPFSPDNHNNTSKQMMITDDSDSEDKNAFGDTSAREELTSDVESNARFVAGNTTDEGYVDNEDDLDDDDNDDDDKDDYTHLWLVQKVLPGKLEEVFLILKEKELLEKNPVNNHTLVRWGLSTVQSCVKISAQPPAVQIIFDTIRRNCEKRTYVMEQSDSQVLLQRLGEVLESRPLSAMNQHMFRCMKCSSIFCREAKTTLIELVDGLGLKCEVCGSNLVVKIDENDDESEHLPSGKNISTSSAANSSNLTNITTSSLDTSNEILIESGTPAVPVTQSKLSASPSQCSIGSAASLDQSSSRESPAAGLGDNNNVIMSTQSVKGDSDIEIISNPSQSSIEVLEVQARLQGTNTPNRKRSSEERQTVAVPQLMTVPEVVSNTVSSNTNTANAGTLLTESSSSGSLTDSICTAYENHPPVSNARRLPSQGSVGDKLIEETSADNSPDNKNLNSDLIMQPPPSSGEKYCSILQDLLNSVNSKLESPDGKEAAPTSKNFNLDDDIVRYNYNNFSEVDHRIKLFLYEKLFKNDDEHVILVLRADVMDKNNSFYPGCLVFSTHSCFLLKVTNKECGDDAESFLDKVWTLPLSKFKLSRVSWDQSILINCDNNQYLLILHDFIRTNDFLKFVSNLQLTTDSLKCLSEDDNETSSLPFVDGDRYMLLQNVLSANNNIKDSNNICTLSISCSTTIKRDNENDVCLPFACIANTGSDLFVLTSDLGWLYKEDETPIIYTVHNIINLIDVGVRGSQLSLHYLDESEGIEESWILTFETVSAIYNIIESVRKPWEAIFSVPLHITQLKGDTV